MKVVERRFLRGASIHSRRPCFFAVLDLEDLDEVPSSAIPDFTDRLCALIPTLYEHRCSTGYRGGFVDRLKEGTYMAHITEHVLIELQCLAGSEVGFGKARMVRGVPRHYTIVCSYHIEKLVEAALPITVELVSALARGEPYTLEVQLKILRDIVSDYAPGPSTRSILKAATDRNIPYVRITEEASLYQLGWGAKQRRIQATMTDVTSHIAVNVASNKHLCKELMQDAGIRVPKGGIATSAQEAVRLASSILGPVAIKPLDANQGKGVTLNVRTADEVLAGFVHAQQYGERVIVEECMFGNDYRVLVVAGSMVAAARRMPPQVMGDGRSAIHALIEIENQNPRRAEGHCGVLTRIPIDEHTVRILSHQNYVLDDVPEEGEIVVLRDNANLSTGGTAEDVTDLVHPHIRQACERAAQLVGLDVAGIDLVCEDIGKPLAGQSGAVLEVNAAPGIRMHEWPSKGRSRPAGDAIVGSLFQNDSTGRIPLVAVTGTNGKTTTTLMIARAFREAGFITGTATTEGIFINDDCVQSGDCTGYWSARAVLGSEKVEAAVLETARGGILKRGLGFDRCDVAVVLNVSADHLGQDRVEDLEDLARVKSVIVQVASKSVVLNAEDDRVAEMAEDAQEGVELIYFATGPGHPRIRQHLDSGGRAVFRQHGHIVMATGPMFENLLSIDEVTCTLGGRAAFNIDNAAAAAAAMWAMELPIHSMRAALRNFESTVEQNPLRMNVLEAYDLTAIVDYAHNIASYRALAETARRCTRGRVIGIVAAPGDRRDKELVDVGVACGESFDDLVIYEMADRRGRARGETAAVLHAGAQSARSARQSPIQLVLNVREAITAAMRIALPGDIVVLGCASDVSEVQTMKDELRARDEAAALREQQYLKHNADRRRAPRRTALMAAAI